MTQLYTKFKSKAEELLDKYGKSYVHIRYDQSNNPTTIDSSKVGLLTAIDVDNVVASLIKDAESVLISTVGEEEPKMEDYVRFDNTLYKIVNFEKIRPTDTTIIYKIYVKK